MWMVDSNDRSKELKMPIDPIYGRKLRPLMPRPITGSCCCIPNPNLWNHPICGLSDYGVQRREIQTAVVSTRWNPTAEQLQALEEMYRRGIRTPSADQIQQIAAKLRRFGKIEGKNVFYWFQNHKARERQKKRRQLELLPAKKTQHHAADTIMLQTKETESSRRRSFIEIEHQKLPTPSNSSTPAENSASMAVIAEWPQHHKILTAKNEEETWQLDLSSSLSPNTLTALKATAPEMKENQTLDLFPLQNAAARQEQTSHVQNIFRRPIEFIEFLPTKKY